MLLLPQMKAFSIFLTGISMIGLCFGGLLAVLPAITADFSVPNITEQIMAGCSALMEQAEFSVLI